jgi:two-component system response regulator MprA
MTARTAAAELRTGRVLVVDDDPDVREAVATALELEAHRVSTATDGLAALKRIGQTQLLIRRTRPAGEDAPLWFAGLPLDRQTREAFGGERRLELTRTEYTLLELFLRNPRQVMTRELIVDRVWSYDFGPTSNPLEVYISNLRRKTEAGANSA